MRLLDAIAVVGVVVLYVLAVGRLVGLPYVLVAVDGHSMEPTLHFGDLALLRRVENPLALRPGDIVLVCGGWRSCILHRLVNITDGLVVTKGDANPYPDPPAPLENVRYVYVLRIPREAYLTPLAAYIVYRLYTLLSRLERGPGVSLEAVLALVLAVHAASLFAALALAPTPTARPDPFQQLRPLITLERAGVGVDGTAHIVLRIANFHKPVTVSVDGCLVGAAGLLSECRATAVATGDRVHVYAKPLSLGVYWRAYLEDVRSLRLRFNLTINSIVLRGDTSVTLAWRQPKAGIVEGALLLVNPNPAVNITFHVKVKLFKYKRSPTGVPFLASTETLEYNVTVGPGGSEKLKLPSGWSRASVWVTAPLPGGKTATILARTVVLEGGG